LLGLFEISNQTWVVSNTEQLLVGGIAAHLLRIPHIKIFHAMSFGLSSEESTNSDESYLSIFSMESDRVVAVSETLKRALVSGGIKESKGHCYLEPVANPRSQSSSRPEAASRTWRTGFLNTVRSSQMQV